MADASYDSMTNDKRIALRASEEIAENGSISAAIAAIDSRIASGEYPVAFGRFMRQVRTYLETQRLGAL